MFTFFILVQG